MLERLKKQIFKLIVGYSLVFLLFIEIPFFEIHDLKGDLLFLRFPVICYLRIVNEFTHSLEHTKIKEIFLAFEGELWLTCSVIDSLNNGYSYKDDTKLKRLTIKKDGVYLYWNRVSFDKIVYKIGDRLIGKNKLYVDKQAIDLYLVFPGKRVVIGCIRRPLFFAFLDNYLGKR